MKRIILTAISTFLIGWGVIANAAQTSSTLNPAITIASDCTLDTSNFLVDLGSSPEGVNLSGVAHDTGTIDVQCPNGLPFMVGVDGGLALSGGALTFIGSVNSQPISYLILAPDINTVLGDGGLGNASQSTYTETYSSQFGYSSTGTGATEQIQTYFMINSNTASNGADTYNDTIVISVVW